MRKKNKDKSRELRLNQGKETGWFREGWQNEKPQQ